MDKLRIMPKDHQWDWSMPVPFSQGWKTGNLIFVGGQVSADKNGKAIGAGDIELQTRNVFENIRKVLNEVGADMKDIVKLNTYYTFEGENEEVTEFWQKMTNVRMEYLANPGPAGTAIRVSGFASEDLLIEVEAIAVVG
ncbi:RidA family protein [Peribacillus cavernae]|uniref:RidA family protein n=1 Tax=Peribacillus cavernae TaxID=1674310 RepID=A0A433HP74_9BACI|nr:RidA family protein [Peribacillus cavernae]MDQ0217407.1 enamine deaminase RidA (YjgF/YER057c/UK114 family) [Peribacillus cavernae]RUQ30145.1 RidA family protein [Peribacillus cavernae]